MLVQTPDAMKTASFGNQSEPAGWFEIENRPNLTVLDPAFKTSTLVLSLLAAWAEIVRLRKTEIGLIRTILQKRLKSAMIKKVATALLCKSDYFRYS